MRQEVPGLVEDLDGLLMTFDTDVDVHAEDEVAAGDVLQVLDQLKVAVVLGDVLLLPVREGVRAGRGDAQAVLAGQVADDLAELRDFLAGLGDVLADAGADFDHRLVHFGFDPLAEDYLALVEHDRDVAAEFPGYGVDDLVLFLDPDGELLEHLRLCLPICSESEKG